MKHLTRVKEKLYCVVCDHVTSRLLSRCRSHIVIRLAEKVVRKWRLPMGRPSLLRINPV